MEIFDKLNEDKKEIIIESSLKEFTTNTYNEASTNNIVKMCNISKGSLYNYFGNKKNLYFYLFNYCIDKLYLNYNNYNSNDIIEIMFKSLENSIALYNKYPLEIKFINMASKDQNSEISFEINKSINDIMTQKEERTFKVLKDSFFKLKTNNNINKNKAYINFNIYVNSLIKNELKKYQNNPELFFENIDDIKQEFKENIEMFLYGIVK